MDAAEWATVEKIIVLSLNRKASSARDGPMMAPPRAAIALEKPSVRKCTCARGGGHAAEH